MTQVVEVPGMGDVEFPDDMNDAQITAAIRRSMPAQAKPIAPQTSLGSFKDPYAYFKPEVQRAVGNTGEGLGGLEATLQMATGTGASILGGLGGIATGSFNMSPAGMLAKKLGAKLPAAADVVTGAQRAMTYQPRSDSGQIASQAVSDAFDPSVPTAKLNPLAWPGIVGTGLGDFSAEHGGPPLLSAGLRTAPEVLMPWAAGRAGEAIRASQTAKPVPAPLKPIPSTEELRAATNAAYKRGEESGVVVPAEKYAKAADEIAVNAKNEALDPVLHPKSSRIVQVLQERKGNDLSLQEAENLRRIALEAEGDVTPIGTQTGDGRIAGTIVDDLDEKIDALSTNKEARALNRRKANSQLLDVLQERAQIKAGANYTQSGLENALRKEFQALAINQRRMKRFTLEQRDAIKKVAIGGPMENSLRNLGKLDPSSGGMAAALSAGLAGGFSHVTGGASLLLPVGGFFAKRGATRMAVRNVENAREALVGRGLPGDATQSVGGPRAAIPEGAIPTSAETDIGANNSIPNVYGVPDETLINAYIASLKRVR